MKTTITYAALSFLACIAAVGGYVAWYGIVGAKSAAVASLDAQIADKTDTISRVTVARASLAEVAGDEATIQNYFVPETGVVPFINQLETLGRSQNTTISVLSVAKSGSGSKAGFTLSVTISGTFDAVMRTIGTIEYAPYDLSLSTLSLAQSDKSSWQASLSLFVGSVAVPALATSTSRV